MDAVERFHAVMNFKDFDRLPVIEWANWWDKTIDRWHGEGLPASMTDSYEIARHFGLDLCYRHWAPYALPGLPPPPKSREEGLIEDEAGYEKIRPQLFPVEPSALVDRKRMEAVQKEREAGNGILWLTLEGFFWFPRRLLGIERHLYAFYDQPELMHRINEEMVEWHIRAVDALCDVCQPDFMTFAEDLSYNNGPMLSEAHFNEFLLPYYKRVVPHLKKKGILVFVDSDGDIEEAVPWFKRAGIEGMLPLERQAGVDIASLRKTHPTMRFLGAFDKMTMNRGEAAMRAEFERLLPVAAQGGFAISCDHQTPPGVSYQDYKLYLKLFHEYAAEAAKMRRASGVDAGSPLLKASA